MRPGSLSIKPLDGWTHCDAVSELLCAMKICGRVPIIAPWHSEIGSCSWLRQRVRKPVHILGLWNSWAKGGGSIGSVSLETHDWLDEDVSPRFSIVLIFWGVMVAMCEMTWPRRPWWGHCSASELGWHLLRWEWGEEVGEGGEMWIRSKSTRDWREADQARYLFVFRFKVCELCGWREMWWEVRGSAEENNDR